MNRRAVPALISSAVFWSAFQQNVRFHNLPVQRQAGWSGQSISHWASASNYLSLLTVPDRPADDLD
jgi:hypothetical protein